MTPRIDATIRAALGCLIGAAAIAQSPTPTRVDDSLRQAYQRTLYSLKNSAPGIWRAENRVHQLTIEFDSAAAYLRHPNGDIRLRLVGYGYGDQLQKAPSAPPQATANRVEYRRGDLNEWYVNTPQGLEQGFTLAHRPPIPSRSQLLTIALAITGSLTPEQMQDAILLRSGNLVVMRYAGLTATDSRGRTFRSRLELAGREIRLRIDDTEAQYPLTIDPTWTQQTELTGSDGLTNDNFGTAVAISGPIAVVGSPFHKVGGHVFAGSAYVFVQSGTTWTQQAELTASDAAMDDYFGNGVAVSGSTAVIGAYGHSSGKGAAYVFVQSGTTWTQQAELTASDAATNDSFGAVVAVNGGTAVIGAYHKTIGSNAKQGTAYVFVQNGTTWSQQAELAASDGGANDSFGSSVAVDGGIAVIGAPIHSSGRGAAYVFVQNGSTWPLQQELTASDGASSDQFANSVSIDGGTTVIGAYRHAVGGNSHQGAAYVFVQSGTTWSQQQELTASGGAASDLFGWAVAVQGSTAVVTSDARNSNTGGAYVFTQSGTTWTQQQFLSASDGAAGDYFGWAVALRRGALVSTAYYHTVGTTTYEGAAYVFTIPASLSVAATHSTPIFQAGGGVIALDVANTGSATTGTATVSDTIDSAFTTGRVSSGCTVAGQTITCTVPSGATAGSFPFGIFVTASPTAAASIANTATLIDTTDAIATSTVTDTITVSPEAPLADSSLTQLMLSGSTDNGACADGNMTLTATDVLQNTSASTLTNPYAVIATLTGGNTLLSESAGSASVAAGGTVTFTFHIQLASCGTFQLIFDVRSN